MWAFPSVDTTGPNGKGAPAQDFFSHRSGRSGRVAEARERSSSTGSSSNKPRKASNASAVSSPGQAKKGGAKADKFGNTNNAQGGDKNKFNKASDPSPAGKSGKPAPGRRGRPNRAQDDHDNEAGDDGDEDGQPQQRKKRGVRRLAQPDGRPEQSGDYVGTVSFLDNDSDAGDDDNDGSSSNKQTMKAKLARQRALQQEIQLRKVAKHKQNKNAAADEDASESDEAVDAHEEDEDEEEEDEDFLRVDFGRKQTKKSGLRSSLVSDEVDEELGFGRKYQGTGDSDDGLDSGYDSELERNDSGKGVRPKSKKANKKGFQALGLSAPAYKGVVKMGYKQPTPIQRKAIPVILEGHDVVAMARTGSGKTAAFVIPMVEKLRARSETAGVRAVILSPTRELAQQTHSVAKKMSSATDLRFCLLIGGASMNQQFEDLAAKPDV